MGEGQQPLAGGNIVDLRQDVLHGLFTIMLVVDLAGTEIRIEDFTGMVRQIGEDTGLELSVDNATWSLYNTFTANVVSTVVPELSPGEWFFRGTVLDTDSRSSSPLVASVVVPDETPPGPLANLDVTLV